MAFAISNIVSAFENVTIGTKVTEKSHFLAAAERAVESYDWSSCRQPGQGFIACPEAIEFVSAGCGSRTADPDDYIVRVHRGQAGLYLKRSKAAKVENLNVVVYTVEAYNADPDVTRDGRQVSPEEYTHVIVAVLASAGPKPQLSPLRFVHNLAGGNNEVAKWSKEEILQKATDVIKYDSEWCTVAD